MDFVLLQGPTATKDQLILLIDCTKAMFDVHGEEVPFELCMKVSIVYCSMSLLWVLRVGGAWLVYTHCKLWSNLWAVLKKAVVPGGMYSRASPPSMGRREFVDSSQLCMYVTTYVHWDETALTAIMCWRGRCWDRFVSQEWFGGLNLSYGLVLALLLFFVLGGLVCKWLHNSPAWAWPLTPWHRLETPTQAEA